MKLKTTNGCKNAGSCKRHWYTGTKHRLVSLWPAILLMICCFQFTTKASAQLITLKETRASLGSVLKSVQKQSGYVLLYKDEWLQSANPVTVNIAGQQLEQALSTVFQNQPLTFKIQGHTILIQQSPSLPADTSRLPNSVILKGSVKDTSGKPIEGASILIKDSKYGTVSGIDGKFSFEIGNDANKQLIATCIGYKPEIIKLNGQLFLNIVLHPSESRLDEVMIQAYGTTTQRLNTGNISTVTSAEIEKQPVMNPLAALEGRVPGMTVVQTTGVPGASFKVLVGGRTSINTNISNDPLFIIDGVPFANNNDPIASPSALSVGQGLGLSPFNSLNPSDIESISVLKDADATAIYGSRGANGVILITTKKGTTGKTKIDLNVYTGFNKVPHTMDMMNTQQYLAMRHEAFANDLLVPTIATAPDLLLYDTTSYTDWKKFLIGNTSHTTNANLSISGGNNFTQFLIGGGYHRETNVFPGRLPDSRASFHVSISHRSQNDRFKLSFSGSYGNEINKQFGTDLTQYMFLLPPDAPELLDSNGNLNWQINGVHFQNPLYYIKVRYTAKINNYVANLNLSYKLAKGLFIKSSFGYNSIYSDENQIYPIAAVDAAIANPVGSASFRRTNYRGLIIEPQIEYITQLGIGKFDMLLGGSWQKNNSDGIYINGSGYTSDDLIGSLDAADRINIKRSSYTEYKYAAAFARLNYNIADKYIVNLTGRRDGSSRFGPDKRFSNFGAVGAAWIFSNEKWVKRNHEFLSFGKLRTSYGTAGNDKIGDYNYLNSWTSSTSTYIGESGLYPTRLYNPNYRWEINKKFEIGLELGFINDRILFSTDWFRNRSSNQLIQYALPKQTGGTSITANFPATVQNTGFEFTLNTQNIKGKFSWNTSINLTIPHNKLIAFPNIESSSYSYLLVGESLNIIGGYLVKRVNPETGLYEYTAKDGSIVAQPASADHVNKITIADPKFYGGIDNQLAYQGWSLDIFMDFKSQKGENYLGNLYRSWWIPGFAFNMPVAVQGRWTVENRDAKIQEYTSTTSSSAFKAATPIRLSSGSNLTYKDASFMRIKSVALSYNLPEKWIKNLSLTSCRLYANAQNLFTITGYEGNDPETQNIYYLPQLRTYVLGIQVTL